MTMPVTDPPASTTPLRRWPRYLLIASLALNLLFVGMLASAFWRGGWGQGRGNPTNIIGYLSTLSPERRAQLLDLSKDVRGEVRGLRQLVRQANADRMAALTAETFDKQRYIDAQTRQIEAETKMRLLMRNVLAETAASMTLVERKTFLRWRGARRMLSDGIEPDGDQPPKR
jgi:uncharacterized membrane protein